MKESLVKMIYTAGVPKILHVDNGKDYTAQTMTGQSRKRRKIDFEFDAETVGFYQSIGIEEVGRSLPYQPWDKPVERFFGSVCSGFSKWFGSYTGTLTGSKTYAKRNKDIDKMLERGELLTIRTFNFNYLTPKTSVAQIRAAALRSENAQAVAEIMFVKIIHMYMLTTIRFFCIVLLKGGNVYVT